MTESTTRRRTGVRPATLERRQAILAAATDVFGSKGYANGTLHDIADQVGMTHAGILHHFGSKDQLLLEVLTYRDQTDVQHLTERHIPGVSTCSGTSCGPPSATRSGRASSRPLPCFPESR
ncbi:TetR/AcrR family transcriptional regulator [Tessaracoccus coleopterorum]|uniref:TetR/AcrR family transcriptional regulator n=1 Tax=Tessaracoccus coleopterorum TaxID=2714950 RepID=UPI0018D28644|nr:helix-turn-helix domain-containing protein [Tessaracoccus coleopterorum]